MNTQVNSEEFLQHLDSIFFDVATYIVSNQGVLSDSITSKFSIGYNHFLHIMEAMDEVGITKRRKGMDQWDVLVTSNHDLNALIRSMIPNAEMSLLGSLMLFNCYIQDVVSLVRYNCFNEQRHLLIYKAITQLWLEDLPVDYKAVIKMLKLNGDLKHVGGSKFIAELTLHPCFSASLVLLCAKLLKAEAEERRRTEENIIYRRKSSMSDEGRTREMQSWTL